MFDIRESAESSAVGHQCDLPAQLDFHVRLELKQRSFVIFLDVLYHYKCSFNKKGNKNELNCEGVYDCNDIFYSVEWFRSRFFPFFFQLLFFKQHHLFWNTEWQYLLWREANTPQSHGLTASNPFCGDALLLSVEDQAGSSRFALYCSETRMNIYVSHVCSTILSAGPRLKRINKSCLILKLASHYFPPWHS